MRRKQNFSEESEDCLQPTYKRINKYSRILTRELESSSASETEPEMLEIKPEPPISLPSSPATSPCSTPVPVVQQIPDVPVTAAVQPVPEIPVIQPLYDPGSSSTGQPFIVEIKNPQLNDDLARWVLKHNISGTAMYDLLAILQFHNIPLENKSTDGKEYLVPKGSEVQAPSQPAPPKNATLEDWIKEVWEQNTSLKNQNAIIKDQNYRIMEMLFEMKRSNPSTCSTASTSAVKADLALKFMARKKLETAAEVDELDALLLRDHELFQSFVTVFRSRLEGRPHIAVYNMLQMFLHPSLNKEFSALGIRANKRSFMDLANIQRCFLSITDPLTGNYSCHIDVGVYKQALKHFFKYSMEKLAGLRLPRSTPIRYRRATKTFLGVLIPMKFKVRQYFNLSSTHFANVESV